MDFVYQMALQAAVFAAGVWIITRLTPKAPARFRHALWLLVLIKFLVPPFVRVPAEMVQWQKRPAVAVFAATDERVPVSNGMPVTAAPVAVTPVAPPAVPTPIAQSVRVSRPTPEPVATPVNWPVALWVSGMAIAAVLLLLRMLKQVLILRRSTPAGYSLVVSLEHAAAKMRLSMMPHIRCSEHAATPMLVGLFRPTILVSPEVASSCGAPDLEAMLLHELAHIKRKDMLVVWLHQFVMIPFFFHPALWLAGKELRKERELACDELVLSESGIDRKDYASGYVSALKMANASSRVPASLAMAEPFEVEKRRLDKILHSPLGKRTVWGALGLLVVAVIGIPTIAGIREKHTASTESRSHLVKPEQIRSLALGSSEISRPAILEALDLGKKGKMSARWFLSRNDRSWISIDTEVVDSPARAIRNAQWEMRQDTTLMGNKPVVSIFRRIPGKPLAASFADRAWLGRSGNARCCSQAWLLFVRGNVVCMITHYDLSGGVDSDTMIDLAHKVSKRVDAVMTGKPLPATKLPLPLKDTNITSETAWSQAYGRTQASANLPVFWGLSAMHGPGVIVSLQDSNRQTEFWSYEISLEVMINDSDIQRTINELAHAGAEAISINGERIAPITTIKENGGWITVNGNPIKRPYEITAIGDARLLQQALRVPGGVANSFTDKSMIQIREYKKVSVPAY